MEKQINIKPRNTASILLNVSGIAQLKKKTFVAGIAVFIPAGDSIFIENITKDLLLFQAIANV